MRSWKRTIDDRVNRRDERRLAAEELERLDRIPRALGRATSTLEDERADALVDRREMTVEQLLGVVRLGRDKRALAELESRLLGRRPVGSGAGHEEAPVLGRMRAVREQTRDGVGEPRDVRAAKRSDRRESARVARRVAPRLLELGRREHDLVRELRDRAPGRSGDRPDRPGKGAGCLERERRRSLVTDADEHVGIGWAHDGVEGLHGLAARLSRVERGPAAREDDGSIRQPSAPDALRNAAQPVGLREDRSLRQLAGRHAA